MVEAAVDRAILPKVAGFRTAADTLEATISGWCKAEAASGIPADVIAAFRQATLAFAGIDHLRFGPLRDLNRLPRIMFWPDKRGVVRRQTQRALAGGETGLLSREAIAAQSAAIQGLPALEILLTPTADEAKAGDGAFRCRLAAAIAANVATLAAEVDDGWRGVDGWRTRLLSPGPDNRAYQSEMEAAAEVLKALLAGLQIVNEQVITPWIDAAQKGKAWAGLPFERSGLSRDYVEAQVRALAELCQALGLKEIAAKLGEQDSNSAWIAGWVETACATVRRDITVLVLPAELAKTPGADIDPLRRVKFYANGLRQIIGRRIAISANILIGFNELDGD